MTAAFDPFAVLGVRPNSTHDQIRARYRELASRYHPDKHRGNPLEELAAAKLVEINRAYEILSDDVKRAAYQEGRSSRPRSTSHASRTAVSSAAAPSPGMRIVRSLGWVVALVFFLRFGMVLGRQVIALVRGVALGLLWVLRLSPIFAIGVIVAVALGGGLVLRSRKRQG